MDSSINKNQILEEFIKNIARLADEGYQERVWIKAEGPECNDIADAIADFFDDGDVIFKRHKDFGITDSQYEILMKLHKKLREFADSYSVYYPDKSINNLILLPQWKEIRDLAKEVLKALK